MVNIYGINRSHLRFFTDAVFGVAITLLAVDFAIPQVGPDNSFNESEIDDLILNIILFIISFVIIALYWITYQSVFNMIAKTTDLTVWLNIIFLMFITMIPFTFKLTNVYDTNIYAYGFYCVVQIFAGSMLFGIWIHTLKGKLYPPDKNITREIRRLTYLRTIIIPAVFMISLGTLIYSLELAVGITFLLIPASLGMRFIYRAKKDLCMTD
ncbi:MAG TPA: TMEM175 family protein [Nitrososphaeraceae archaeon]|nr:TMEM175 family protein [Nitrososphaeraceae archaeon]